MATLTATPELRPGATPRVRLDVSGVTDRSEVTITRRDADNRTRGVRTAEPLKLASGGVGLAYDYEVPYGTRVRYSISSVGATSAAVTLDVDRPYLVDPGAPSLSLRLDAPMIAPDSWASRQRATSASLLEVLGRESPVVQVQGRRKAPTGTINLRTDTLAQKLALEALINPGYTLLLNVPPALGWGLDHEYVALLDVTEEREGRVLSDPARRWELSYAVVDPPVGALRPEWTYGLAAEAVRTYADARVTWTTYGNAARDMRVSAA